MAAVDVELADVINNIPDQNLEELIDAIKDGANTPAEAFGFDAKALNSLESMALGYYRARRYREASLLFGFILRLSPGRGGSWRGLGACAHQQKNFDIAILAYNEALLCDPRDLISHTYLGEVLCLMGQKDAGVASLKVALALGKDRPEYKQFMLRARAIVSAKGGVPSKLYITEKAQTKVSQADAALKTEDEPEYDPDREITPADMRKNPKVRAAMKEIEGLLKEGKVTLRQIGGFTEKEMNGAYALAVQFLESNRPAQATQLAGFLMLIDPHQARHYRVAGVGMQRLKQYAQADLLYAHALALEENDPRTLVLRGETKIMMGKLDDGVAWVKRGVEAAGKRPELDDVVKRGKTLIKQFSR